MGFLKDFIYFQSEGKGGRERETSLCGCLSCAPPTGTWPATQACALTGNGTNDPLVHRLALNPLSHTSQGKFIIILSIYFRWQMHIHLHSNLPFI